MKSFQSRLTLGSAAVLLSLNLACSPTNLPPTAHNPIGNIQAANTPNTPGAKPASPPLRLRIKQAEFEVSQEELNKQFQAILALSNDQRLRQMKVSTLPNNRLFTEGRIKVSQYLPEVSFSVDGPLSAKPGNVIHFVAEKVKVAGIPISSVLDVLGIELANIAKFDDPIGRIVQSGNQIDLVIQKFTSDAIIEGQIKQLATGPQGITIYF